VAQVNGAATLAAPRTGLFIGNRFVDALDGRRLPVINPHDGTTLAQIALAGAVDVDRAVLAAQAAFPSWSRLAAADRGRLLLKLADAIEANAEELAQLESRDTGHPIRDTRRLDVPRTAACYRYFGGMADKFEGTVVPVEAGFLNYVTHEAIGVVGQICPWNFPIMFTSWKMGPALAAGNTVVLKPSELTPLSTLRLAELAAEVGFPDGVINVVPGLGEEAGQRLVDHPDVRKISFTGSTAVGRRVMEGASRTLKRVGLELGGKGANVVFADADLDAAIGGSAFAIFHNQGQACIAGSRLILHEAVADEFLARFGALAASIRLGDPLDERTEMGPLTSAVHRDRVMSYVTVALDEGGTILQGGKAPDDPALAAGYYVEPTIVAAPLGSRVTCEEVFGPFVSVARFRTDEEALALANATEYGLGSGLWTRDLARAHRFGRDIRSGMVWINAYKRVNPGSPFGGVGASGQGREMGFEAMRQYTEPKSVWVNVDARIPPFYPR